MAMSATSFNSLDSLYVKCSSTNSGDFDLASIEVVPEPTSLAALAVGAVALIRRRKSK